MKYTKWVVLLWMRERERVDFSSVLTGEAVNRWGRVRMGLEFGQMFMGLALSPPVENLMGPSEDIHVISSCNHDFVISATRTTLSLAPEQLSRTQIFWAVGIYFSFFPYFALLSQTRFKSLFEYM